ncbi:MAG: (Fe-S)-binding protein [Candidatus Hydrothermarchaeaceae archaeon]
MECMKCGDCQAVCPTFAVTGDESAVARGRIRLIRALNDGELELTDTLVDKINSCMMCLACTANCPSGVKVDEVIISARKKIAEERGLPLFKRISNAVLSHSIIMKIASLISPLYRPIIGNVVPKTSRRTFSGPPPKVENPKMRVAFFAGCMVNYVYPEIGDAVLEVLAESGIEVLLKKEKCCGAPALYCGDEKTAKRLAKANVKRFHDLDVDAIVTCCPTCENVIKGYPSLLENDEMAVKAAEKVCDISWFLAKSGFKSGEIDGLIGYHESCHLKYGTGTEGEMQIIKSLQKDLKELDGCCGFAGMFSLSYPDLSKRLSDEKLDNIEAAGVDTVVTGCPGCKMYIEKGLKQRGVNCRVMHTVELLDEAYR